MQEVERTVNRFVTDRFCGCVVQREVMFAPLWIGGFIRSCLRCNLCDLGKLAGLRRLLDWRSFVMSCSDFKGVPLVLKTRNPYLVSFYVKF